jgi:hypothetical protein
MNGIAHMIQLMVSVSTNSSSAISDSCSTTFLPLMYTIPNNFDCQSLSRSSTGSLSWQPSLCFHAVDDGVISNQGIIYPGDLWVIALSRCSSLWCTTSMMDLGEEFEFALRQAKDAQPELGFKLGLAGVMGEGSPVTSVATASAKSQFEAEAGHMRNRA